MIYKLINSKVVIARIFDEYNIDYSGFISRVPNWIYNAMRKINLSATLIPKIVPATVINYKVDIPIDTEELVAVSYYGYRLPRVDKINENVVDDMSIIYHPIEKYQLNNNGYIVTTFSSGDIKFYIKAFPSELDATTNLFFPLIPDNEDLIDSLNWYLLRNLLYRGHNLKGLSLRDNNPFTNPAMAWEKARKVARLSISQFDDDDMRIITDLQNSLLLDYNKYNNNLG